jgi:ATP-dependent helicase/DNAse subunit B
MHRKSKLAYYNLNPNVTAIISDEEWQQLRAEVIAKIWDFVDQMRTGRFAVNPSERKKTCKFCDFAALCRYSRDRIEPKRWR